MSKNSAQNRSTAVNHALINNPKIKTKYRQTGKICTCLQFLFVFIISLNEIIFQEAAISVFSTIKKYLDDQTMRKLVLPKAKSLFHKSTNVRVSSISKPSLQVKLRHILNQISYDVVSHTDLFRDKLKKSILQ